MRVNLKDKESAPDEIDSECGSFYYQYNHSYNPANIKFCHQTKLLAYKFPL